jgi:putative tricarboxylic transport membrane protein
MGASEYFLIGMIGVTAVAAMSAKSVPKSMMSGVLGLMAGTVGIDLFTGFHRFTMGLIHLDKGFPPLWSL